jgi:hypothetical protein
LGNLLDPRDYLQRQGGAAVADCKDRQQPQDIQRVMEVVKKFGLEFLPPPGA